MKRLNEMMGTQFILRCSCGMNSTEDNINFGVCRHPFYNERLNVIVCERCGQPTFLSALSPEQVKHGSEIERALLTGYFQLQSDQVMLDKLEELRKRKTVEAGPLTPLDDILG